MKSNTGKTIFKIVAFVLVLLIAALAIGFIAKFTSGFTTDFKTFYVSIDGKDILTKASGYHLGTDESMQVEIKYTFSSPDQEPQGYGVMVIPNIVSGQDFDFVLNDETYSFQAEKDLTNGFEIKKNDSYFTIKPKGNLTEILKGIYPSSTIEDCSEYAYADMFSLVVTSYNGKASVVINFTVSEIVQGVEFDKEVIFF